MIYSHVRSLIKSGDLLAWSHRGWRSWRDIKIQAVRFFTQSEYSHVGLAWVVGGRVFVLEAVMPLVRIYPLSKLGDFYHLPSTATWTPDVEELALSKVGESYSQWQAIKAFFQPLKADATWECAQYVLEVLACAGIDLGPMATPSAVVLQAQQQGSPCFFINSESKP